MRFTCEFFSFYRKISESLGAGRAGRQRHETAQRGTPGWEICLESITYLLTETNIILGNES